MVRAMCGVQLKNRKRSTDLMSRLKETIDQLTIANSVHWYGDELRREDGHVLRMAVYFHVLRRVLHFQVEGQRKKGRPKKTWMKQVEVKVGMSREDEGRKGGRRRHG